MRAFVLIRIAGLGGRPLFYLLSFYYFWAINITYIAIETLGEGEAIPSKIGFLCKSNGTGAYSNQVAFSWASLLQFSFSGSCLEHSSH